MTGSLTLGACAVLLISTWVVLAFSRSRRRSAALPPGPKGWPLINNLLDVPSRLPWITYAQWGRKYGSDIVHLRILNSHVVVLNTAAAACELLDKKSSIYSDRPWLTMLAELCNMGEWNMVFMPYNPAWKAIRAHFRPTLGPERVGDWRDQQTRAARDYLNALLDSPEHFIAHTRHVIGANILQVAYGINVLPKNDPWVDLGEKANWIATVTVIPGSYLVDTLPILKYIPAWFPGARFKREAQEWRVIGDRMRDAPFDFTKDELRRHIRNDSVAARLLNEAEENGKNYHEQEWTARRATAIMYGAGADTSVSALETFLLAMTLHPEIQERARKELDPILEDDGRLPGFSDELPYIMAIVKESLRWNSVAPLGTPHRLIEDDVSLGYFIPKGTMVLANIWAMSHDESVYANPFDYNPERFLGPNPEPDPTIAFGFGRRICPGRDFAMDTLQIIMASVLAVFEIAKATKPDGSIDEPQVTQTDGFLSHPGRFNCVIKPRTAEAADLVRLAASDV